MGWASGSRLADEIWDLVEGYVPDEKKAELAVLIIDEFESMDCDTMYETGMYEFALKNDDDFAVKVVVNGLYGGEDDNDIMEDCVNELGAKRAKQLFEKVKQKIKEEEK